MDINENDEEEEHYMNFPDLLSAKLLFFERPTVNKETIMKELEAYFSAVNSPGEGLFFLFPDIEVSFEDNSVPAQCCIFMPDTDKEGVELPAEAYEQNWDWAEANDTAQQCRHELLVTDFMTRNLPYKARAEMFCNFLVAVTKALQPQAIYSASAQKVMSPDDLIAYWDTPEKAHLNALANVRLYTVGEGEPKELLMDTVGLYSLGLADFQIRFTEYPENDMAQLLWNYAYYLYENGDLIENGNTIAGLGEGSKWLCERQVSLVDPERIVIDVKPQ